MHLLKTIISTQPFAHIRPFSYSYRVLDTKLASQKLFEDAAVEESQADTHRPSTITRLEQEYENWTGDEPMEHAVLRMLVDKYKPLRGGQIATAEEKLKKAPPSVAAHVQDTPRAINRVSPTESWANVPLIAHVEGHRPWHTTFKAPAHATSSIRVGNIAPRPTNASKSDPTKRQTAGEKKKAMYADRLTKAKEGTLDYKLGVTNKTNRPLRPNPVSMRGWNSLIEDKIEKARQAGLFKTVQGRGKPLARTIDEANPFIAREEFLMNRIVQRNGAAPPWVEVQGDLESSVYSFREILRQAWIRRAVLHYTTAHPPDILPNLSIPDVSSFRDGEWEDREKRYHEHAVEEVNSLVRKYNAMAPYAVRRAYYSRQAELERVKNDSEVWGEILRGIQEKAGPKTLLGHSVSNDDGQAKHSSDGLGRLFMGVLSRLFPRLFER